MDKLLDKTLTHTPSSIHTHPGRKKKHRKTNKTYKQTLKLELTTIQKDCKDTKGILMDLDRYTQKCEKEIKNDK